MPWLFPVLDLTHIFCLSYGWNRQRQKNPTGIASALKRCFKAQPQHLNSQENNSSSERKGLVLPLSRGNSMSSDCNSPFLTGKAKSAREEGFLHPTCPRRVGTHTSVIYHHASSACQPDKDFSPGASKLEMLFRLQKQLHVFCFLSQRTPASMQMKGSESCQGCGHSTSLSPPWPGKAHRDGGRTLERHRGHRNPRCFASDVQLLLQGPAVYRKQFPLASASAIDYSLPFVFPPFPPFLEQKCLPHSAPLSVRIKGGKKGQTLRAQTC